MPQSPTLSLNAGDISEIIRYLHLTMTLHPHATTSSQTRPPKTRPLHQVLQTLQSGPRPPTAPTEQNTQLDASLAAVQSFLLSLTTKWNIENDTDKFIPTFKSIVSQEQLEAVLMFIDADNSGTLELGELQKAFQGEQGTLERLS